MSELIHRARIDSVRAMAMYRDGASDREMAAALGCTRRSVSDWRRRRKLPLNGRGKDASRAEEFWKLYEQGLTDNQVAEAVGVDRARVAAWRQGRKLPCHREAGRGKCRVDEFQRLYEQGKTDREIAEALGCPVNSVGSWRRRNGLPLHPSARDKAGRPPSLPVPLTDGPFFMTDHEILYSWRTALDQKAQIRVLAELNAVSVPRMLAKLEELGIDVSPYRKKRKGRFSDEGAAELWQKGMDDAAMGRALGVSDSTVKQWREANGLAANAGQGRPCKGAAGP